VIAIVAVDKNWGIGKDGKLLVSIPEDQRDVFRRYTIGNTIVYGRKTLFTFPGKRPLPGRMNIVLSKNTSFSVDGALVLNSLSEIKEYIRRHMEEVVYVIGGAEVYRLLLPYCDEAIVTRIDAEFEADSFFENLDLSKNWVETSRTDPFISEKGIHFCVSRFRNLKMTGNCAMCTND